MYKFLPGVKTRVPDSFSEQKADKTDFIEYNYTSMLFVDKIAYISENMKDLDLLLENMSNLESFIEECVNEYRDFDDKNTICQILSVVSECYPSILKKYEDKLCFDCNRRNFVCDLRLMRAVAPVMDFNMNYLEKTMISSTHDDFMLHLDIWVRSMLHRHIDEDSVISTFIDLCIRREETEIILILDRFYYLLLKKSHLKNNLSFVSYIDSMLWSSNPSVLLHSLKIIAYYLRENENYVVESWERLFSLIFIHTDHEIANLLLDSLTILCARSRNMCNRILMSSLWTSLLDVSANSSFVNRLLSCKVVISVFFHTDTACRAITLRDSVQCEKLCEALSFCRDCFDISDLEGVCEFLELESLSESCTAVG